MCPRISVSRSVFLVGLCAGALACGAEATDPYPDSGNGNGNGSDKGPSPSAGASSTPGGVNVGGSPASNPASGGSAGAGAGGSSAAGSAPVGGGGSGGAASGGATGCTPQVGAATDLMIADVDTTMSNAINMPRVGYWYTFAAPGATVTPAPDPSGATPFTVQTSGGANSTAYYAGLTGSGGAYVGLGFALNDGGKGMVCTYDVSAYTGISFYYKSTHPMRVAVATTATTAAPRGSCVEECDNHHGKKATTPAAEWTQFSAKWTELTQDFGTLSPFDKTQVLQIQFQIEGVWNATAGVTDPIVGDYELAVDEITFTTN